MDKQPTFYTVTTEISRNVLRDHLLHGYESRWDFEKALRALVRKWQGRVGECVGERHGFLLLRFHDTPGGNPDEEWIPRYLLKAASRPDYLSSSTDEKTDEEIDKAFGFD